MIWSSEKIIAGIAYINANGFASKAFRHSVRLVFE